MRIKETCSCGASIEIDHSGTSSAAQTTVEKWRRDHMHTIRPFNYPYVTYGQGGSGGYSPITYTNTMGKATTDESFIHRCGEHHQAGADGICVWCGKDLDEMGQ